MRFRSLKYASSFFSKNENDVNLAVASTVCLMNYSVLLTFDQLNKHYFGSDWFNTHFVIQFELLNVGKTILLSLFLSIIT